MTSTITRTYTNNDNYTKSDSTKIAASGGVATLLIVDNPDQTFQQTYTADTGFTYTAALAEFDSGLVQQKDSRPTDATFGCTYSSSIDASWGGGTLTGTGVGSPVITGGKLDLTGAGQQYVTYVPASNLPGTQTGAVKLKYTPNYSGAPSETTAIFSINKATGDLDNVLQLYNATIASGSLALLIKDSSGIDIVSEITTWNPTAGVEYEIEINYDLTAGATRIFIDGVQLGSTATGTGTRDTTIAWFAVGARQAPGTVSNGKIDDFLCFSSVQHTANYTPGYTIYDYIYDTSTVELPQFSYPGIGEIQAFTAYAGTDTNDPRYTLNGKYWDGAAFSTSDGSWAQSNVIADINTNIASFPVSDTLDINIIFNGSNTVQQSVDITTVTYTGKTYPTDNPWIKFNETTDGSELLSFTQGSVVETGSDLVKYAVEIGGQDYYVTGGVLTVSDGYNKTNTAAEIETNKALFLTGRSAFRIKVYLHSDDGSTTPTLDSFTFTYDASLPGVSPTLIDVNGFVYTNNAGLNGDPIKVRPYQSGFINEGIFYEYEFDTISTTDSDGYFSGDVAKNPSGTFWEFKIGKQRYKVTLENISTTSVDFADLNPVLVTD